MCSSVSPSDAGPAPVTACADLCHVMMAQSSPELLGCEVIHERVQGAVQTGQTESDGVSPQDQTPEGAAFHRVGFDHEVQGESDVVRNEAEQKHGGAAQHHPQRLPLLPVVMDRSLCQGFQTASS